MNSDCITDACKKTDLLERLGELDHEARYKIAYNTFKPYIDNSEDHLYGSKWLSDMNWATKQGNDNSVPLLFCFFSSLMTFIIGTGALILAGLIWLFSKLA